MRQQRTLEDRFWSKVTKTDTCWLWTASRAKGYGSFSDWLNHRKLQAHRVSYEMAYGIIPDGLWVLHTCDVRACVRPDHLFLGTAKDNTADMMAKGRAIHHPLPWHKCSKRKLEPSDVAAIRVWFATTNGKAERADGIKTIAARFSITREAIYAIVNGKNWRNI